LKNEARKGNNSQEKSSRSFNPNTGFEFPNLKLGPERAGSEPNHPPADDGCKLKPEPSFLGFSGMVTKEGLGFKLLGDIECLCLRC
jgi:hypothetical protein